MATGGMYRDRKVTIIYVLFHDERSIFETMGITVFLNKKESLIILWSII